MRKLLKLALDSEETINLVMHHMPDMDTFASVYILEILLSTYNINSRIIALDESESFKIIKRRFTFSYSLINNLTEEELNGPSVFLDCVPGDTNSTSEFHNVLGVIDHHNTFDFTNWTDLKYVDIRIAGACVSILVEYACELGIKLDRVASTIAYMAINQDTRGFLFSMSDLDLKAMRYLIDNIDQNIIMDMQNNSLGGDALMAVRNTLNRFEFSNSTILGFAGDDMIPGNLAIVAELAVSSSVLSTVMVISKYVKQGVYKFSIRTEELVAEELAKEFMLEFKEIKENNAGGKRHAAGGQLSIDCVDEFTIFSKFLRSVRRLQ